jgi:hypothetical protein
VGDREVSEWDFGYNAKSGMRDALKQLQAASERLL